MSWKIFILQTVCLVCFASFAAEYASYPHEETLSFAQRQLHEKIDRLEELLAQLKTSAANRPESEQPAVTVNQSAPVLLPDEKSAQQIAALSQRLDYLEKRQKQLWQATADLIRRQNALVRAQQDKTEADRVRDWMSSLEAEKKAQVQAAYREEMEKMQNTVSASPNAPPAPETMFRLLEESREHLKVKLKDILSDEEYQAFLQSLEAADLPLPTD